MRRVELPWPYKGLSPNSNLHWRRKAEAKAQYRFDCKASANKITPGKLLTVTFRPPNRRWDRDNMIGAFKAGQDGIADAMGIDDRNFVIAYRYEEPVKHGAVIVEVIEP